MTREIKIGMAVAGSFLSLVGAVVGTKMYKGEVPQQLEGLIANVGDAKKGTDDPSAVKPPSPPRVFPAGFTTTPLPNDSSGFPIVPPPLNEGPPTIPPAPPSFDGFNPPKRPDAPPAIADAANDITKALELQKKREQERLQNLIDLNKKELANAGGTIIDGVNKNVGQFKDEIQKQTTNAFDNLPQLPPGDPNKFTIPPVNVADNTIVGGGKKPNDPLPKQPAPPLGEAPKTIVGGAPPTAPPNFSPFNPKDTAPPPATFGNDPTKPSLPPVPSLPPGAELPPIPKDLFPPGGGNSPPSGSIPGTQLPPIHVKPPIETPPTTIVAPRPNVDPLTPPLPPPVPPLGNSFGPNGSVAPSTPPQPPFGQGPFVPATPTTPPPFVDPSAPPPNAGFAPLVQPTPVVKTDNSKRYVCQGNENYALISFREYGNENFARALEEYNRDLPSASDGVRAQPARLQQGTVVMVPSQNYLVTHERYARFVSGGSNLPPAATPRPFGNDIGIGQPTPGNNVSRPAATADAGTALYRVPAAGMYLSQVAERQLGSALRWIDIYRLNPGLQPEQPLREGLEIRVPVK